MKTSSSPKDPMWTVIEEGGPHHTKNMLNTYLRRLKRSGREELIRNIQERRDSD
jgi:hypothetical protein